VSIFYSPTDEYASCLVTFDGAKWLVHNPFVDNTFELLQCQVDLLLERFSQDGAQLVWGK